jgi:hypothetical protein
VALGLLPCSLLGGAAAPWSSTFAAQSWQLPVLYSSTMDVQLVQMQQLHHEGGSGMQEAEVSSSSSSSGQPCSRAVVVVAICDLLM